MNQPLTYQTRRLLLGLQSLERRREVAQAVFVAKLIKAKLMLPSFFLRSISTLLPCTTSLEYSYQNRPGPYLQRSP